MKKTLTAITLALTSIIAAGLILSSGCSLTLSLNLLNNRSSQPINVGEGEAWADNATTGGADISPDVDIPMVP